MYSLFSGATGEDVRYVDKMSKALKVCKFAVPIPPGQLLTLRSKKLVGDGPVKVISSSP